MYQLACPQLPTMLLPESYARPCRRAHKIMDTAGEEEVGEQIGDGGICIGDRRVYGIFFSGETLQTYIFGHQRVETGNCIIIGIQFVMESIC